MSTPGRTRTFTTQLRRPRSDPSARAKLFEVLGGPCDAGIADRPPGSGLGFEVLGLIHLAVRFLPAGRVNGPLPFRESQVCFLGGAHHLKVVRDRSPFNRVRLEGSVSRLGRI